MTCAAGIACQSLYALTARGPQLGDDRYDARRDRLVHQSNGGCRYLDAGILALAYAPRPERWEHRIPLRRLPAFFT